MLQAQRLFIHQHGIEMGVLPQVLPQDSCSSRRRVVAGVRCPPAFACFNMTTSTLVFPKVMTVATMNCVNTVKKVQIKPNYVIDWRSEFLCCYLDVRSLNVGSK